MSLVDIIIVNYNSTDFVLSCIQSIENSLEDSIVNIYVEDNHSSDRVERVKDRFPSVSLNVNPNNIGFAAAINRALSRSSSPFIVLLNPDSIVKNGFIKTLTAYMEKYPKIGIVGPKILNSDGTIQGSARSFPTPLTALFGRSSFLTRCFPNNRLTSRNILTTRSDGTTPVEVDWVSGACMMIRREALQKTGYLDERFFMYWEDADLCRRIWEHGWKVAYYPMVEVIHFVGGSSEKSPFKSILEFHKSSFRIFCKWAEPMHRLFSPFVAVGLTLRFAFVLGQSHLTRLLKKEQQAKGRFRRSVDKKSDERIRLLRIISRLNIGGPSIHAYILSTELDTEKFRSRLIAGRVSPNEGDMSYLFKSSDIQPMIIPELQREISLQMDVRAFLRIFKMIFKETPDIVHSHTAKAGFIARLAVSIYNLFSRTRIRTVHTFHGHVFEGYFKRPKTAMVIQIERFLAMLTDVIIAISMTQKKQLSEHFRIARADKIKTIGLGFDLNPFLNCKSLKGQFRRMLDISKDTFLVGIIGRLAPIKNHEMFLNAVKILLETNPGINIKFVVVGDGELRNKLKRFCDKQHLNEHVIFCGWVQNVSAVYADLDLLVLTSLNEGTPVSIIEAMAASVPVIATDAGGVSDLMGDSDKIGANDGFMICKRGILCRKNDAEGFAKGLAYFIDNGQRKYDDRLTAARQFVQDRFVKERLLKDMSSLYQDLAT